MNKLDEVLKKISRHPDFLGLELTGPNDRGAIDDTPLHIVCRKGDLDDVKTLVSSGANVNIVGDLGNTPLHFAAMSGHKEIVIYLLKQGANPKALNEFSQTPLKVAELGGKSEIVEILKK